MSTQSCELHELRASTPAQRWIEAYPVGNGIRGAMCAGLSGGERLWLNDTTAWSGRADADPLDGAVDRGPAALENVRTAIADGDIATAEELLMRMQTPWTQAYLPLGWIDLAVLDAAGAEVIADPAPVRRLDLATGIASHEYRVGGDVVRHRTWADLVTGAIVHEVTAAAPVRLRVRIDSLLRPRAAARANDGRPGGGVAPSGGCRPRSREPARAGPLRRDQRPPWRDRRAQRRRWRDRRRDAHDRRGDDPRAHHRHRDGPVAPGGSGR